MDRCLGVVVDEAEADGFGIVGEGEFAQWARRLRSTIRAGRRRRIGPRLVERGESELSFRVRPIEAVERQAGGRFTGIGFECPGQQGTGLVPAARGFGQPGQC